MMKTSLALSWVFALSSVVTLSETCSFADDIPSVSEAWQSYVSALDKDTIQPDCMPRRDLPSPKQYVGTVFTVHGFTACPQQYDQWAKRLNQNGFAVYSFLLPGHGHKWRASGHDEIKTLPTPETFTQYSDLAALINQVAAQTPGVKVISGVSLGGTVALESVLLAPSLYDRALLSAPLLEIGNAAARTFLSQFSGILAKVTLPFPSCMKERKLGRAGVCEFEIKNAKAAKLYGKKVMSEVKVLAVQQNSQGHFTTQVQFIGVEQDQAVRNESVREVIRAFESLRTGSTASCVYRTPANHSLFSKYDIPWEDKFWMKSLLRDATELALGKASFTTQGASKSELGTSYCEAPPSLPKAH